MVITAHDIWRQLWKLWTVIFDISIESSWPSHQFQATERKSTFHSYFSKFEICVCQKILLKIEILFSLFIFVVFFLFFVEKVVNFEVALNPGKHVNKKKFQKLLKFVGIFLRRKKKTASEHRTRGVKMEGKGRGLEL